MTFRESFRSIKTLIHFIQGSVLGPPPIADNTDEDGRITFARSPGIQVMPNESPFRIIPVETPEHLEAVKSLFIDYTQYLGIDLSYQGFDSELQSLPGNYSEPWGALLLAFSSDGSIPLGCIALRPLNQSNDEQRCCEMKRLYVSPQARGMGLGRALVNSVIQKAKDRGYREIRLDTLPFMEDAIQMYRRFGFVEIPSYYDSPIQETLFLALDLTQNLD